MHLCFRFNGRPSQWRVPSSRLRWALVKELLKDASEKDRESWPRYQYLATEDDVSMSGIRVSEQVREWWNTKGQSAGVKAAVEPTD